MVNFKRLQNLFTDCHFNWSFLGEQKLKNSVELYGKFHVVIQAILITEVHCPNNNHLHNTNIRKLEPRQALERHLLPPPPPGPNLATYKKMAVTNDLESLRSSNQGPIWNSSTFWPLLDVSCPCMITPVLPNQNSMIERKQENVFINLTHVTTCTSSSTLKEVIPSNMTVGCTKYPVRKYFIGKPIIKQVQSIDRKAQLWNLLFDKNQRGKNLAVKRCPKIRQVVFYSDSYSPTW